MADAPPAADGSGSAPPPGDSKGNNHDFAETAVKVAGVALAVSIGISLLRSRKVKDTVEEAAETARGATDDVDYKMRGAKVVGQADEAREDLQNDVSEKADNIGKETKKAASGLFGRAKKAANKVKNANRGLTVQPGDTLWGLSQKYNVPVEVIRTSNNISGDLIVVGTELVVPGAGLLDNE